MESEHTICDASYLQERYLIANPAPNDPHGDMIVWKAGRWYQYGVSVLLLWGLLACGEVHAAPQDNARNQQHQKDITSTQANEATRLSVEVARLYEAGKYTEAIPLAERALQLFEQTLGPAHPYVAAALNNLAELYRSTGAYTRAEPLYQRSLQIREQTLGPTHPDVVTALHNLAKLYRDTGAYARAEPLFQRSLQLREQALGPTHADVGVALHELAGLYTTTGAYAQAEPLYQRSLHILQHALGPTHFRVATVLNGLAALSVSTGDYAQAEPLYQRSLGIFEQTLGQTHPDVAIALNNLADLYSRTGAYAQAEPLYQRSLQIKEQTLGPRHPEVAIALNNLAALYSKTGTYAQAEPLYQRSLQIREQTLGPTHPEVAIALNNLAALYRSMGAYSRAEPLYQRSLRIAEQAFGPAHPNVSTVIHNLAMLYHSTGTYARAEPLYKRSLRIAEQTLGPHHPDVAGTLHNLAALHVARRDAAQAAAYLARANDIIEHNMALYLSTGSERQKLQYLATFTRNTDMTIALHTAFAPNDPAALRLALTTVLRRKSRALDALVESLSTVRRSFDPEAQALFTQLTATRARLAALVLRPSGTADPEQHRTVLQDIEQHIDHLEAALSRHSAIFQTLSQPVTIAAVQAVMPSEARLVEFVRFYTFDFQHEKWLTPHYAAYVLAHQGEPGWVPLGESSTIDAAVQALRTALRDPATQDVKQPARALDALIMQPLRPLLGTTRTILLAPDSQLHLVPFGALVDPQGRYLVEQYHFLYLTTGRDLLRLHRLPPPSQQDVLILADPDFGRQGINTAARSEADMPSTDLTRMARQAVDFSQLTFHALPGTAAEARALQKLLPTATVLTKARATEGAIKHSAAPRIVHIATHGFFLEDVFIPPDALASRRLLTVNETSVEPLAPGVRVENPLLRSGLALAGFNARRSGEDDGILTALEVAGLNLWGTRLVVLSACDTGVGEVHNGEGVYGLRRALVLAGAETQMISLWPVDDDGTQELMRAYYAGLLAGQGRGEAFRQVQLHFLTRPERQHPFFWASFIQSGAWSTLTGQR